MLAAPADLENAWVLSNGDPVHLWRSPASERGSALPIVFVHGFGVSGASLLPTATLLARTSQTFVPDLPGYGRSPAPPVVLSIRELRTVVLGFLDALGIERAVLVGHSMGAIISLEVAQVAQDRVDRLVLIAPAEGTQVRSLAKVGTQLAREVVREPPRLQGRILADLAGFGARNVARLYLHMRHYPMVDLLRTTTPPTLVVLGQRDPLVNDARIIAGAARNERVQVECINGAAHGIPYSHAPQLAGLITSFVERAGLADETALIEEVEQLPTGVDVPSGW